MSLRWGSFHGFMDQNYNQLQVGPYWLWINMVPKHYGSTNKWSLSPLGGHWFKNNSVFYLFRGGNKKPSGFQYFLTSLTSGFSPFGRGTTRAIRGLPCVPAEWGGVPRPFPFARFSFLDWFFHLIFPLSLPYPWPPLQL